MKLLSCISSSLSLADGDSKVLYYAQLKHNTKQERWKEQEPEV